MKNPLQLAFTFMTVLLAGTTLINAQNPIIQTYFTADPAPMVHDGTVYLYTSHDEDSTVNNFFTMYDWRCYSTTDMVNWTDHGAVASLTNFKWIDKTNGAWAPQCIERNGKFYLYVPVHGEGISVLTADSPTGPFSDPLGRRLIVESEDVWHDIDPTVFIDDDGQAYLYWGNPSQFCVKLNEDMISYDRNVGNNGIISFEMTTEAFGEHTGREGELRASYTEGPWVYKRNNLYYLAYAARGIPEYIAYSTATSPKGPWVYQGLIMERADHLAFTNHAGIIDYKGNSYFFYHDQVLSGGKGFKRSVSVEQFEYNADGSIPLIVPTKEGVTESVSTLDPYSRVEAETIAWSEGLKTAGNSVTGVYVTKIDDGDYLKVRSVDLERGAGVFEAMVSCASEGGQVEIRLNGPEGKLLGTLEVVNTGGAEKWETATCELENVKEVHDLCLVFRGKGSQLFNFDWWRIKPE